MNLENLIYFIEKIDYDLFKNEFLKQNLSDYEKQRLLLEIIKEHYNHDLFLFFKLVFDLIIENNFDLNFATKNSWTSNLLSYIILIIPNIELFDYFISKNANVNFFVKDKYESNNQTCLDFAEMKFYDAVEDNDFLYFSEIKPDFSCIKDDNVCINKSDYEELLLRSNYLKDIYDTYKLKNHIIAIGGKRFAEL